VRGRGAGPSPPELPAENRPSRPPSGERGETTRSEGEERPAPWLGTERPTTAMVNSQRNEPTESIEQYNPPAIVRKLPRNREIRLDPIVRRSAAARSTPERIASSLAACRTGCLRELGAGKVEDRPGSLPQRVFTGFWMPRFALDRADSEQACNSNFNHREVEFRSVIILLVAFVQKSCYLPEPAYWRSSPFGDGIRPSFS